MAAGSYPLDLLINALSAYNTCYILGAGASSPHVPTMSQLPDRLAPYAVRLGSFPGGRGPDSPLRRLIDPLIEKALSIGTLEAWKASAMTPATIAVALEHVIAAAHWLPLPQYAVFQLIPRTCSVVSFNWDGLAGAQCHQTIRLHPHGVVSPYLLSPAALDELFHLTQLYDSPDAREQFLPGLVMPGEEDAPAHATMRERVFQLWLGTEQAIIIGYRFGLGSDRAYDRIWLDTFVEAFRENKRATIHILDPDALGLRSQLTDLLRRAVNVHAWPLNWYALSHALLEAARLHDCARLHELRVHANTLDRLYHRVIEAGATGAARP